MKEDSIIKKMTETHEQHLEQLEEKADEFIKQKEADLEDAQHKKAKDRIRKKIDRYLKWHEDNLKRVDENFQQRVEKRLSKYRKNRAV